MSNFFLQDCPQVWQKKWRLADLLFSVQKKKNRKKHKRGTISKVLSPDVYFLK